MDNDPVDQTKVRKHIRQNVVASILLGVVASYFIHDEFQAIIHDSIQSILDVVELVI